MNKLLVIGCGSIGRRHIENFKAAGVEQVAGVDARPDRLEQLKTQFGLKGLYQDYRQALEAESFEAVVVATPPPSHVEIALAAARQGCHLFIEKPLADSAAGLDDLARVVADKKLVCLVAYCYRFIPSVVKMRELLQAGRIGRPLAVNLSMS
ncbi:MAG: Gfo/Idh/MocA family oxidoreductase, partial [Deltaproteobacteria bacterium]|nr:Gfo/Idh/MocA family oxidoreductase [Deltaproteobacteria bacterium]